MRILEKLRERRLAEGLTQAEVAARLGCTQTAIHQYEAGKRLPRFDVLLRLAELYHCSIYDFIEE